MKLFGIKYNSNIKIPDFRKVHILLLKMLELIQGIVFVEKFIRLSQICDVGYCICEMTKIRKST